MAKSGDAANAARLLEQALRIAKADGQVFYHAAIVRLIANRRDEALEFVRRSLDAGYSDAMIAADEDLDPLQSDPRFVALVKRAR